MAGHVKRHTAVISRLYKSLHLNILPRITACGVNGNAENSLPLNVQILILPKTLTLKDLCATTTTIMLLVNSSSSFIQWIITIMKSFPNSLKLCDF